MNGTRYLVLFGSANYDFICNRIRYLIGIKSRITYFISHNYAKTKVDSYYSLSLEETVLNKNKNNYYYNIFLEKCLYQLRKKSDKL